MALRAERQDESPSVRARRKTEATSGGSACLRGPMQTRVPREGRQQDQVWERQPHIPGQTAYLFPFLVWRQFRFYVLRWNRLRNI